MHNPKFNNAHIFVERRGAPRERVEWAAYGLISGADGKLGCQVVNISETGARLRVEGPDILPEKLKVFIPETGMLYRCQIVWRDGPDLGVKFLSKSEFDHAIF